MDWGGNTPNPKILSAIESQISGGKKYSVEPNRLGFFSQLERVISDPKTPKTQKGSDWKNFLQDPKRGVRAQEVKSSGLSDLLTRKGSEQVSRQEILDHLRGNEIGIREVHYGSPLKTNVTVPNKDANAVIEWGKKIIDEGHYDDPTLEKEQFSDLVDQATRGDQEALGNMEEFGVPSELMQPFRDVWPRNETRVLSKYSGLQTPGGKNYREILMTLPPQQTPRDMVLKVEAALERYRAALDKVDAVRDTPAEADARRDLAKASAEYSQATWKSDKARPKEFFGEHWDEPDVLAHVRLTDRTASDGKKVLFVEEIQSDWGQTGREKGFIEPVDTTGWKAKITHEKSPITRKPIYEVTDADGKPVDTPVHTADTPQEAIEVAAKTLQRDKPKPGPFVTETTAWTDLATKRILRMAAEQGYDRVVWTTGQTQANRSNLGSRISFLNVERLGGSKEPRYAITARLHGGRRLHDMGTFKESDLTRAVGQEMAGKIRSHRDNIQKYHGLDLHVGGEGLKAYYDKIVPESFRRVGGKFGAKIGQEEFDITGKVSKDELAEFGTGKYSAWGYDKVPYTFDSPYAAKKFANENGGDWDSQAILKGHSIDITPEMREGIMQKGFPQFKVGETGAKSIPTGAEIKANLPKFLAENLVKDESGMYRVETPRGEIIIDPTKSEIALDTGALEAGHGPEAVAGVQAGAKKIVGAKFVIDGKMMAQITDAGALPHEVGGHVFLDHFATDTERSIITKALTRAASEEGRSVDEVFADRFSDWFQNERGKQPTSVLHEIYQRIYQFFEGIYRTFRPNLESIYKEVGTGKAFQRAPETPGKVGATQDLSTAFATAAKAVGDKAENFKNWFGKSMVVEESGEPMTVYHSGEFQEDIHGIPKVGPEGMHFGTKSAAEERPVGKMVDDQIKGMEIYKDADSGRYHWDLPDGTESMMYTEEGYATKAEARAAGERAAMEVEYNYMGDEEQPPLTHVYLKIEKPMTVTDQGGNWRAAVKKAKALGHDGLIYINKYEDKGSTSYVVFSPKQIKSVKNVGTFNPKNPDIRYGLHGGPEQPRGTTGDVLETLKRKGSRKPEKGVLSLPVDTTPRLAKKPTK